MNAIRVEEMGRRPLDSDELVFLTFEAAEDLTDFIGPDIEAEEGEMEEQTDRLLVVDWLVRNGF